MKKIEFDDEAALRAWLGPRAVLKSGGFACGQTSADGGVVQEYELPDGLRFYCYFLRNGKAYAIEKKEDP